VSWAKAGGHCVPGRARAADQVAGCSEGHQTGYGFEMGKPQKAKEWRAKLPQKEAVKE